MLDFLAEKYALSKSLDAKYAGLWFSDLPDELADAIRTFRFNCEVLQGISDKEVLEIFARLNTYSVKHVDNCISLAATGEILRTSSKYAASALTPGRMEALYEMAYLRIFLAWEQFLEASFANNPRRTEQPPSPTADYCSFLRTPIGSDRPPVGECTHVP